MNRVSLDAAVRLMNSPGLPRLALLRLGSDLTAGKFEELRIEAARRGITLVE